MTAGTRELVMKEARSLTPVYVAAVALVVLAIAAPLPHRWREIVLLTIPAAGVLCALAGAATFAREKETGTIQYLAALPLERRKLFAVKTAMTAVVPAVMLAGVLLFTLVATSEIRRAFDPSGRAPWLVIAGLAILGAWLAVWLYASALFFSALFDTVIVSALAGIAGGTLIAGGAGLMVFFGNAIIQRAAMARPPTGMDEMSDDLSGLLLLVGKAFAVSPFGVLVCALGALFALAAIVAAFWGARRILCGKPPARAGG